MDTCFEYTSPSFAIEWSWSEEVLIPASRVVGRELDSIPHGKFILRKGRGYNRSSQKFLEMGIVRVERCPSSIDESQMLATVVKGHLFHPQTIFLILRERMHEFERRVEQGMTEAVVTRESRRKTVCLQEAREGGMA